MSACEATYEQATGPMHSDAPRKAVMNRQAIHRCWMAVPSFRIHVSTQVKMNRIPTQMLLAHVFQFHIRKMD